MNNSLERLVEGIIATLRTDVIPNVADAYARGQSIGVIDLLNNIAPRLEWARAPIAASIAERRAVIDEVRALLQQAPSTQESAPGAADTSAVLLVERDNLDAEICDLIAHAFSTNAKGDVTAAKARLLQHMHDEAATEMKLTKKPLFAEIAKGSSGDGA